MFPNDPSEWRPADAPPSSPAAPPSSPSPVRSASSSRRAGLAASLLAVALFGGLIGFAADRWLTSTPTHASAPIAAAPTGQSVPPPAVQSTPGPAPRVGAVAAQQTSAPTDPQQQAIQDVIRKGDQEQAQAFASNDPSVMQDTSTPDFYQQQVAINQDLNTNGVSDIKLLNIEWGQITVNGSTATATAWETWSTSYADGTTEQSRDRNVYTLTLVNGSWKISADAHPDDPFASGGGAPTGVTPGVGGSGPGNPGAQTQPGQSTQPGSSTQPGTQTQPGQPVAPVQPSRPRRGQSSSSTSQNWSGYAATGGTYTAVSGTWTVPQFNQNSNAGADAAWVGIGGVNSRDLIQAGTQQTVSGSGSTQYQAWVETLPQASHPVPLTINPGDSITVSITLQPQTQNQWLIAFKNNTTGQTFQVTENYASSMSSAEWIEEAPSAARGRQMPLDNFGSITFNGASTVKNGQTVNLVGAGAQAITMISRGGQTLATPSGLSSDGAGFSVTRS